MTTNRTVMAVSAAILALGLAGSGALSVTLDRRGGDRGFPVDGQAGQPAPPWITLSTVALGSFRGLAVDVLWYRAGRLQEEGRYFEANQLAHWITTLQPRFPQVWSYQAWNMAYNISVATHTPEERWDWVNKGIALLRDKGIVYNPTSVKLYRELGWIFYHKFGRFMDEMHWYYRQQLAIQWQQLLGSPPPGATTQEVIDRFRQIADAPDTIDQLIDQVPGVAELVGRLHELGYQPNQTLLRQIGRVQMLNAWPAQRWASNGAGADDQASVHGSSELAQVLVDPEQVDAMQALLACVRKRVLRDDYHMDPLFMLQLMERYGPLDWRQPVSHGCYWSEMGVEMAVRGQGVGRRGIPERVTGIDLLNTNRQTIHAMQELTRFGRLSLDPLTGRIDLLPDARFVPAYSRAVELARQRIESGAFGDVGHEGFDLGHENFLLEAMTVEYLYGDVGQARGYYKKARDLYGQKPHNRSSGRYRKPIAEFVVDYLRENLGMMTNTNQFIRAMLRWGFDRGLAYHQMAVFDRYVQMARLCHDRYQHDKPVALTGPQGRLRLRPFDQVLAETYLAYMQESDVSLLKRSRAWTNTPLKLRRRVSDRVLPVLQAQARHAGFVPERMFPPAPSGAASPRVDTEPGEAAEAVPVQIERQ